MIKVEDYISGEYVKEVITFREHMFNKGLSHWYDKNIKNENEIYISGYFSDKNGTFYHISILGGPEYLKQKLREIKLNKILK